MNYSNILSDAIERSGLKLFKIAELVGNVTGSVPSLEHLSRLKNGKTPPAADKFNEALAEVLGIDPIVFKTAAYLEKIPADVLEKLREDPKSYSA